MKDAIGRMEIFRIFISKIWQGKEKEMDKDRKYMIVKERLLLFKT